MPVTPLTRVNGLWVVDARVTGPRGTTDLALALDTAASETLIRPAALAVIGYDVAHALGVTRITSAIGVERGYVLRVERFSTLGFALANHRFTHTSYPRTTTSTVSSACASSTTSTTRSIRAAT